MSKRRAFTLIELLIVITILAILAAILFPVLRSSVTQGYKADEKSALRQMGIAKAIYDTEFGGEILSPADLVKTKYLDASLLISHRDQYPEGYGKWLTERAYPDDRFSRVPEVPFTYSMLDFSGQSASAQRVYRKMQAAELKDLGWVVSLLDLGDERESYGATYPEIDPHGVILRLRIDGSVMVTPAKTRVKCPLRFRTGIQETDTGNRLLFFFDAQPADFAYIHAGGDHCERAFVGDGGDYSS